MSRFFPESHLIPLSEGATQLSRPVRVVVVGGGIAGLSAATVLVERGARVTLLEAESYLGGRAGSFPETLPDGTVLQMERGFHAFFRQYYNLRALLSRIDPELSMLRALADYPVLGPDGMVQSFSGLPKRTPFQVLTLAARSPYLRASDLAASDPARALAMLAFDSEGTYQRFDSISADEYLSSIKLPERARRMLFDVFAHSFFNPERAMSAAELLMMFHFYFTGNPEGLIFDVSRQPMGEALWRPFGRWLSERGADVRLQRRVDRVTRNADGTMSVEHGGERTVADQLVLALDVAALQGLVAQSPALQALSAGVASLQRTSPFAVLRLWLDRPVRGDRAPFAGTTGVGLLDNISVYERFQDESAGWAERRRGSVVELHAYAVPAELSQSAIRHELMRGFHALYPEARDAGVLHERFLLRDDCPAFAIGSHEDRPGVRTALADVALAGDAIRAAVPCALMERAAITGILAANELLAQHGVRSEPIRSVPTQGLLARGSHQRRAGGSRRRARGLWRVGRALGPRQVRDTRPDHEQAELAWIRGALETSSRLPSGGWYAVDASHAIDETPRRVDVRGRALVVYRDQAGIVAAPEACPHMGASLEGACVRDGKLVCPWHGLSLGRDGHRGWRPLPGYDDGVLFWVRMDDEAELTDAPILSPRPSNALSAVIRVEARCEPRDVIQNRLDPWHGAHYHPHSFGSLRVIEQNADSITVRVAYRVAGPLAVEVDARFHCPDPRTIVMTIVEGEGVGSVVETHATPLDAERTAIIEATLATSERIGFRVARALSPLLRPAMRWAARRLWIEDAAYAERLYELRRGKSTASTASTRRDAEPIGEPERSVIHLRSAR